jgi:negative regulator of flagellin synthesis FlgM
MSIDFRNPLAGQSTLLARLFTMIGRTGAAAGPAASVAESDRRNADSVSLSGDARRIAEELRRSAAAAPIDAHRIANLKQAIETGNFRIDTARIADKVSLQYGDR